MRKFDIFTIRQWQQGYTLQVDISRPRNAPKGRHTLADRDRRLAACRQNEQYYDRIFTFDEVMEEISRIRLP